MSMVLSMFRDLLPSSHTWPTSSSTNLGINILEFVEKDNLPMVDRHLPLQTFWMAVGQILPNPGVDVKHSQNDTSTAVRIAKA